jgi:hypothetical protein
MKPDWSREQLEEELRELGRQILENPRKKNQILFEWVYSGDPAFRSLIYVIASERGEMTINISHSNVANLNLGEQIGHIESVVQTIAAKDGEGNQKFAEAIRSLTEAVRGESQLNDSDKKEAIQVLGEIAEQAGVEPEKRSSGKVKALLLGFPAMIAVASNVTKLWEASGPAIRTYFGF